MGNVSVSHLRTLEDGRLTIDVGSLIGVSSLISDTFDREIDSAVDHIHYSISDSDMAEKISEDYLSNVEWDHDGLLKATAVEIADCFMSEFDEWFQWDGMADATPYDNGEMGTVAVGGMDDQIDVSFWVSWELLADALESAGITELSDGRWDGFYRTCNEEEWYSWAAAHALHQHQYRNSDLLFYGVMDILSDYSPTHITYPDIDPHGVLD